MADNSNNTGIIYIYNRLQLVEAAVSAGIKIPEDINSDEWDGAEHWQLFTCTHLNKPLPSPKAHFANAKLIASLSADEASEISDRELKRRGFLFGDQQQES